VAGVVLPVEIEHVGRDAAGELEERFDEEGLVLVQAGEPFLEASRRRERVADPGIWRQVLARLWSLRRYGRRR
jgi:hypothetical protein